MNVDWTPIAIALITTGGTIATTLVTAYVALAQLNKTKKRNHAQFGVRNSPASHENGVRWTSGCTLVLALCAVSVIIGVGIWNWERFFPPTGVTAPAQEEVPSKLILDNGGPVPGGEGTIISGRISTDKKIGRFSMTINWTDPLNPDQLAHTQTSAVVINPDGTFRFQIGGGSVFHKLFRDGTNTITVELFLDGVKIDRFPPTN